MKIQNYAQLRAKNAFEAAKDTKFAGANDGKVVKKIPHMIIENGLLGAMAFAIEKREEKTTGYYDVFRAILKHLKSSVFDDMFVGNKVSQDDVEGWFGQLASGSAEDLRMTTAESMAYLSYLRRFAKKN